MSCNDVKRAGGLLVAALTFLALLLVGCASDRQPGDPATSAIKILVEEEGLYRLTKQDLQQSGMSVSELSSTDMNLLEGGRQVPFLVADEAILFYAEAPRSRYTRYRPYILRSGERGLAMPQKAANPSGRTNTAQTTREVHLEENFQYASDAKTSGEEGPWFWQTIGPQAEVLLSFSLTGVEDGAGRLEISLYGTTHNPNVDPDHSLQLILNGQTLADLSWDGQTEITRTLELPAASLQEGANTLTLRNLPEEYLDIMRLDWVRVDFNSVPLAEDNYVAFKSGAGEVALQGFSERPLILDVSEPGAPTQFDGWTYNGGVARLALEEESRLVAAAGEGPRSPEEITPIRSGDWRTPQHQADLIIVTTDDLAPALEPLVKAREEQGLSVVVVPAVEIYDTFGDGAATPDSINDFLRYAYQEWQEPRPRYLLLVGEATSDYRGYLSERPEDPVAMPQNMIPPYLVPVNFSGETVSDARLADVEGDARPEMAVGRWPLDDAREVRALVERTVHYEQSPASTASLFAADGSSGEFLEVTRQILEESNFPAEAARIMNGPTSGELAGSWNEGNWLVTYTGHGSLELWGKDDVFSVEAAGNLESQGAPPIVLQLTCLSGLFAHPEITSLSEVILQEPGGPVLVIGATSLTLSAHQEPFAVALLQALQDPAVERMGDALQEAKMSLNMESTGLREISDTFGLLGDPSALIARP